jgi:hypothetical protein
MSFLFCQQTIFLFTRHENRILKAKNRFYLSIENSIIFFELFVNNFSFPFFPKEIKNI